jgi:hypothetical protein
MEILEEEVYVEQPQGYEVLGQEDTSVQIKESTVWIKARY